MTTAFFLTALMCVTLIHQVAELEHVDVKQNRTFACLAVSILTEAHCPTHFCMSPSTIAGKVKRLARIVQKTLTEHMGLTCLKQSTEMCVFIWYRWYRIRQGQDQLDTDIYGTRPHSKIATFTTASWYWFRLSRSSPLPL